MPVALHVSNLSLSRGGVSIVDGVSLSVAAGTCVAIVGPGASGKSSVLDAIAGRHPSTGRVLLGAHDVSGLSAGARARAGLAHVAAGAPDRQRLALIAAAVSGNPGVLLLDDPSGGSAAFATRVAEVVSRACRAGTTVLLAEQRTELAAAVADEVYVLQDGRFRDRLRGDDPGLAAFAHAACLS